MIKLLRILSMLSEQVSGSLLINKFPHVRRSRFPIGRLGILQVLLHAFCINTSKRSRQLCITPFWFSLFLKLQTKMTKQNATLNKVLRSNRKATIWIRNCFHLDSDLNTSSTCEPNRLCNYNMLNSCPAATCSLSRNLLKNDLKTLLALEKTEQEFIFTNLHIYFDDRSER